MIFFRYLWQLRIGITITGLLIVLSVRDARTQHCQTEISVPKANPFKYEQRGSKENKSDRCEGVFVRKLSSTAFRFVSFTHQFDHYDLEDHSGLRVTWPFVSTTSVQLHSVGIKPQMTSPYRMDTQREVDDKFFYWPLDILYILRAEQDDIGVLGWIESNKAGLDKKLHLPLSILQNEDSITSTIYTLSFISKWRLHRVYFKVLSEKGEEIISRQELGWGYYPAEKPIEIVINIASLKTTGIYKVELDAERFGVQNSFKNEFWFYHTMTN